MTKDEVGLLGEIQLRPREAAQKYILADYYADNGEEDLAYTVRWLALHGKWPANREQMGIKHPRYPSGKFFWRFDYANVWKEPSTPHWFLPWEFRVARHATSGCAGVKKALLIISKRINDYRRLVEIS